MKWSPLVVRMVTLIVFALLAQVPAGHAMILVTAPAVHTSTPRSHVHARHAWHRHARHHHAYRAQIARRGDLPPAPAPQRPAPHRSERRAALPRTLSERRHPQGHRDGQAMLPPAAGDLVVTAVQRLDERQNESVSNREGRVTSGRGPPRASPCASLPPASPAGPSPTPRSAALPSAPHIPSRAAAPTAWALLCPHAGDDAIPRPHHPEPVSGRSHARRPEGTAACLTLPS